MRNLSLNSLVFQRLPSELLIFPKGQHFQTFLSVDTTSQQQVQTLQCVQWASISKHLNKPQRQERTNWVNCLNPATFGKSKQAGQYHRSLSAPSVIFSCRPGRVGSQPCILSSVLVLNLGEDSFKVDIHLTLKIHVIKMGSTGIWKHFETKQIQSHEP